jgi:hypothetical protein
MVPESNRIPLNPEQNAFKTPSNGKKTKTTGGNMGVPKEGFTGIWIPACLWKDQRVPVMLKVLIAHVHALDAGNDWNGCFATNAYFSKIYGRHEINVSKWISRGKDLGYLIDIGEGKRLLRATLSENANPSLAKTLTIKQIENKEDKKSIKKYSRENSLHVKVRNAFLSITNGTMFNFKKECPHINQLIEKAEIESPDNAPVFLNTLLNAAYEMREMQVFPMYHDGPKPFLPSFINSSGIYPYILQYMKNNIHDSEPAEYSESSFEIKF